jgi:hypothetical protein
VELSGGAKRGCLWLFIWACGGDAPGPPADPGCEAEGALDGTVTYADVQSVGTHNSYHVEPATVFDDSHRYTHPPLTTQLELGVRTFELDVHARTDGGFSVFHLPVIDPETTCADLADCLGELKAWSDAHRCHVPILVWIEPKDEIDGAIEGLELLEGRMQDLDDALGGVWPDARVIRPGDLLRGAPDLATAIAEQGWPLLREMRGKIIFALLDSGARREEVLAADPVLGTGRLFVDGEIGEPWSVFFKVNNAVADRQAVEAARAGGGIVTSNASDEASDAAAAEWAAAWEAGPHHVCSDFVDPGGAYVASLAEGSPRCERARVEGGCGPDVLEPEPTPVR